MRFSQYKKYDGPGLYTPSLVITFIIPCIFARHIPTSNLLYQDLETSAAEPRPVVLDKSDVETPVSYALPLVYSADDQDGPLSVASEKVEKTLAPVNKFSYNEPLKDEFDAQESTDLIDYQSENSNPDQEIDTSENVEQKSSDTKAESTDHGKEHDHDGEFEKGGGKEFESVHKSEHGEKGEKKYDGHHHHEKSEKGHHEKDHHHKEFDEKGGDKEKFHHNSGYFGEHHKEEKGEKGSEYDEHGDHNKGHNTKGTHYIHKKDEFEKKTEFFDEDDDSSEFEKHGGFSHKDGYKKGGHQKSGYEKGGSHKGHHGEESKSEKGGHHKEEKGQEHKGGHDEHHSHHQKYGEKEGHGGGKKWSYAKGDGDGGQGGKGSHSHVSVAVQKPPINQKKAEHSSNKDYEPKESKQKVFNIKPAEDTPIEIFGNDQVVNNKDILNVEATDIQNLNLTKNGNSSKIKIPKKYKLNKKYNVQKESDEKKENLYDPLESSNSDDKDDNETNGDKSLTIEAEQKTIIHQEVSATKNANKPKIKIPKKYKLNKNYNVQKENYEKNKNLYDPLDASNVDDKETNDDKSLNTETDRKTIIHQEVSADVSEKTGVPTKQYLYSLDKDHSLKTKFSVPAPFSLPKVDGTHLEFDQLIAASDSPKPQRKKKLKKRKKVNSEKPLKKHNCDKAYEPLEVEESKHFVIVTAEETKN